MRPRVLVLVIAALAAAGVATTLVLGGGTAKDERPPVPSRPPAGPVEVTTAAEPPSEVAYALASEPADPAGLARAAVLAETAVRDPDTPASDLPGWARAQQAAYRQLARRPEWDADVATAVGPELAPIAAANAAAFRELWALTAPRDELPDWVIVEPPPADELLGHYRAAEEEFGVPWEYLAGIHLVETRMGRIRGASSAGARGPMQFLPSTWERYGEGDIEDPGDAIRAAARYLVAAGAPGDMRRALFAYNHSDHYVNAIDAYASMMRRNERAYLGYYHWDVYYRLTTGDVVLPVGWTRIGRTEEEGVVDG